MKRKAVNYRIRCDDNEFQKLNTLKLSIRNRQIAICIDGSDGWAHMDIRQAEMLRRKLGDFIGILWERIEPK